jgi:Flp pilus assembly protein CpaB
MEMEYRDPASRGKVIAVLGVVMGLIAGAVAFYVVQRAQAEAGAAGRQEVPLVVAARDIATRTAIVAEDMVVRNVPLDDSNAVGTYTDPSKLVGLIPSVPILNGQPIMSNMLAGQADGETIPILGPTETIGPESPFWRAVSVTVPDDRAAGGLIEAGQTVDMVATININLSEDVLDAGRYTSDRSTKVIYQDMLVIAKTPTAYVMKAPIGVAEELGHMQASGAASFTLLVRPTQDLRPVDANQLGTTTTELIERYGLDLPRVFPPGSGRLPAPQSSAAPSTPGVDSTAAPSSAPSATPGSDATAPPAP